MNVSAILLTRDTREMTLANARRAGSALGPDDELVVVDNASADGTAEALAREVPRARLLVLPANLGFARAANLGAGAATGGILLFLNSDAELTAEALKALRAAFLAHPRAGAVGALLLDPDGPVQRSADGVPSLLSEIGLKPLLRLLDPGSWPGKGGAGAPVEVPSLVGACLAVSREAFAAVEGFDERFFFFLEETDLCLRLRRCGWEVLLAPTARVVHGQGRTARKRRPMARVEYDLSRYRFLRKHRGPAAAGLVWVATVLRLAGGCLLNGLGLPFSARLRDRAAVQGYRLAWHLLLCPPGWGLEAFPPPPAGAPAPSQAEVSP